MAVYEVPTSPRPQSFSTVFPNGVTYQIRLIYQFNADHCWIMDISDVSGNPIVCGIPLVTGCDLLEQYAYLGLGCSLYVTTDGDQMTPPRFYNLGTSSHLWCSA